MTWSYPSRSQCDNCHIERFGYALGPNARQLNRADDYPGGRFNQLAALAGAGYLTLPAALDRLPKFPDVADSNADLDARARAYLDANCGSCHRPEGAANADIDLRAHVPLADTRTCDREPGQGDLDIPGAVLIAPGDPDRSLVLRRMQVRGEGQMPPLASHRIDAFGTTLIGAWIQSLPPCP